MKDDKVYIWDMVQACRKIRKYLDGATIDDLSENSMLFYAVVREFQVLGEAAGKTSEECRGRFHDIPWRVIIDMRNVVVHEYSGIEIPQIWETAQTDIPPLLQALLPMFQEIESDISSHS